MALRVGQWAEVRVAVATLWSDPARIRPIDAPAISDRPDLSRWVGAMDADQRLGEGVLSQLLLGERVRVDQIQPDGWVRVVALEQPAVDLDPRGYPGWLPAAQLTAAPGPECPGGPAQLLVDAKVTNLHTGPAGPVAIPGVVLGTRLTPTGPARQGWQPVRVPGSATPMWLPSRDVVPDAGQPASGAEVVDAARRLIGTPYLWGGVSPTGVDCSGLIMILGRRFGIQLPRDAYNQAAATIALPPGAERPGDLYFFARPGRRIHHVGIVAAFPGTGTDRRMVHACYRSRELLEEQLPPERTATLVGAHRPWPAPTV